MIVWVSGPTGGGKSSLARILRDAFGFSLVEETIPKELFSAFSSDPIRYCASLQSEIMRSRFEGWQNLSNASHLIFDRSVDEDSKVFCRMHWETELLDDQQYEHLQDLSQQLQNAMPEPDLIIFMCPERRVLDERVTQPTHPSLIVQSLDRQVALYTQWLATRREDVLRMDNSNCSLQMIQRLFSEDQVC
jgi:deoxyadenosine/deoxycytidine kinase